jgi:hypothetical protein
VISSIDRRAKVCMRHRERVSIPSPIRLSTGHSPLCARALRDNAYTDRVTKRGRTSDLDEITSATGKDT